MHVTRFLKFLSLPAALGLGTALVVACSSEGPTESTVQAPPMSAAKKKEPSQYDALNGNATVCVQGYHLEQVNPGSGADDNGDGWICKKGVQKK